MLDEALWIILLDGSIGVIQWLLIIRFLYGIFLPETSRLPGIRHINQASDPLLKLFGFATPDWIIMRIRPLYVAFYLLMARFYILPTAISYDVTGLQALSLEALITPLFGL